MQVESTPRLLLNIRPLQIEILPLKRMRPLCNIRGNCPKDLQEKKCFFKIKIDTL